MVVLHKVNNYSNAQIVISGLESMFEQSDRSAGGPQVISWSVITTHGALSAAW